jgi:hypothetical protein
MDETEMEIYRKGRTQTEGLALFDIPTTHPDSVMGSSQAGQILRHLQSVGPLTSLDALHLFGCARLASRISDLKNKGYPIRSRFVDLPNGKRVSEYSIKPEDAR